MTSGAVKEFDLHIDNRRGELFGIPLGDLEDVVSESGSGFWADPG